MEEKWGKKFNFNAPNNSSRRRQSGEALASLNRALNLADGRSVEAALSKTYKGRSKEGLYIEFDAPDGEPRFEEGRLILPVNARPGEILRALEGAGIKRKAKREERPAARRRAA